MDMSFNNQIPPQGDATPEQVFPGVTFTSKGSYAVKTGTATSDATAAETDIALGKTAYVNGVKITGTNADQPPAYQTSSGTQNVTFIQDSVTAYHADFSITGLSFSPKSIILQLSDGEQVGQEICSTVLASHSVGTNTLTRLGGTGASTGDNSTIDFTLTNLVWGANSVTGTISVVTSGQMGSVGSPRVMHQWVGGF